MDTFVCVHVVNLKEQGGGRVGRGVAKALKGITEVMKDKR